jgi:hypothetical protein
MPDPTSPEVSMETLVALCKRRGFIFQSSEIYGGINGFFDYGPLGAELKKNIRDCWWDDMVRRRDDVVGRASRTPSWTAGLRSSATAPTSCSSRRSSSTGRPWGM